MKIIWRSSHEGFMLLVICCKGYESTNSSMMHFFGLVGQAFGLFAGDLVVKYASIRCIIEHCSMMKRVGNDGLLVFFIFGFIPLSDGNQGCMWFAFYMLCKARLYCILWENCASAGQRVFVLNLAGGGLFDILVCSVYLLSIGLSFGWWLIGGVRLET